MISKKFKVILLALFVLAAPHIVQAADPSSPASTQVPALYYAGVIPVQWEKNGPWKELADARKAMDSQFSLAVKASKRFVILNDDLIRSLWSTSNGRRELESDYEVSAYLSLDISSRGDMAVLTARMLSPKLETRLQESEVIPVATLASSGKDQITSKLADLVARMLNRLPVDANVTSINGGYVTLSGGSDQGLKVGQKYDVVDPSVASLHPATGSWLKFNTPRTGSLEIIEVKSQSSIGKVLSLTKENSIKLGQGIRIEDISSRSRFAPQSSKVAESTKSSSSNSEAAQAAASKVSSVNTEAAAPAVPQAPAPSLPASPQPSQENSKNVAEAKPNEPASAQNDGGDAAKPTGADGDKKDESPSTDNFTARIMPKGSDMRTWAGMKMWSISGSATANASLPVWLVNAAAADIYRVFSDTIDYNYGAEFGYGPTGNGNFLSYNLHGAGRWHMYMKDVLPGADDVHFGLMTSFTSANITGEKTGGFDLSLVRFTMGVHGWAKPDFIGQKVEWTGEVFYPIYYSGQFGVLGKFREITSGSSMAYRVGMYVGDRPNQGWQYGAAFDFEDNSWSLKTGKTAKQSSIGLQALARREI